ETISVGGRTAFNQHFGVAKTFSSGNDGKEGIAGMSFSSISRLGGPPFYQTIFDQGGMPKNVFGFGLWTSGARLDLGAIPARYKDKLVYSPVDDSKGWWSTTFQITGLPGIQTGVIDTGTTLIVGPREAVRTIFKSQGIKVAEINRQIWGKYPVNRVPSITLTFGGKSYTIGKEALSFVDKDGETTAGLIGANIGIGSTWIIGGCFLQDVYAAFDVTQKKVGFTPK
ncbi:hypothetical protein OC835_007677, partial [Tilletia horrida]